MWKWDPNETSEWLASVALKSERSSLNDLFFLLNLQFEEKPQKNKVWNIVNDAAPVQSPKPSSPDSLKASTASVATVSNINIDVGEDPGRKKLQGSKSVVSHGQAVSQSKERGKPDSSPPPLDPPLDLQSMPGDAIKEEEEFVYQGLHIHQDQQATNEDHSMNILKDTNVKSSGLALKTYRSIKNDTVTLLKGALTHPSEIQVSDPDKDVL